MEIIKERITASVAGEHGSLVVARKDGVETWEARIDCIVNMHMPDRFSERCALVGSDLNGVGCEIICDRMTLEKAISSSLFEWLWSFAAEEYWQILKEKGPIFRTTKA